MPKVSIAVYNVEPYLRYCLDSVVNQTLRDIEIIIVNDCSPANEELIILEYAAKDDRIIYIKNKQNKGLGAARNIGFSYATGEYFGCVDSDDWIELDMFEKMYNKAFSNNLDFVVCSLTFHYSDSSFKIPCLTSDYIPMQSSFTLNDLKETFFHFPSGAYLRLYKKEFFDKYIKYPEKVKHEDIVPMFTAFLSSNNFGIVDEPLYNYRVCRIGAITSKTNTTDILIFMRETIKVFKQAKMYDKYYKHLMEFLVNAYEWYEDKPEELYNGVREILLDEMLKYKSCKINKKVKMFLALSYQEYNHPNWFYKKIFRYIPLKLILNSVNDRKMKKPQSLVAVERE